MLTNEESLRREWRLIHYKRFRVPSLEELIEGLKYEYANSIVKHIPHWSYGKWGSPWGFAHKDHLIEALQKCNVRARTPLTTKYLCELLKKYPLEFKYKGMTIIVTPFPSRDIYINGHCQLKLPPTINNKWFNNKDELFLKDWKCLILGDTNLPHNTLVWELIPQNILYKYFNNIVIDIPSRVKQLKEIQDLDEKSHQILKSKNMTTKELRDLLKEKPLNFEFEGLDLVALPPDKYGAHPVYVNGREQYSIGWFEKLHFDWFQNFGKTKEQEEFQTDWRRLLSLNNGGREPQSWRDILHKYYKGIVENVAEHILTQKSKSTKPKAPAIIRNLLSERKNYGKNS